MPAGDFVHCELTFVSTEIQLTVVQKFRNDISHDMAALRRLMQDSYAKVKFLNILHDGMVMQSVWPI